MATESFFDDVVIEDEEKAIEILNALKQPMKKFDHSSLPEEANEIWFKNKRKEKEKP